MPKMKFLLDNAGVRELLCSPKARELCENLAHQALDTLGSGYGSDTRMGKNRVRVEIQAETPKAYYHNLKHNSILKAVGKLRT